jgi:hypothetical protein
VYCDGFGDVGSLVIWMFGIGKVPVSEVIVIDPGDSEVGAGAKGVFAVNVY